MIPLPNTYRDHNQIFTLVRREGDVCLFVNASKTEWEIIRVKRHRARTFPDGRVCEAREAVPPSEAWGTAAYTCTSLERAEARFTELCALAAISQPAEPSATLSLADDQTALHTGRTQLPGPSLQQVPTPETTTP